MELTIGEIKDKNIWENFLLECKEKTFLQSWNWGEFQIKMGNKIWRLGICGNEQLVGVALVTKIEARRGTFLLMQHGPSFAKATEGEAQLKQEVLGILLE